MGEAIGGMTMLVLFVFLLVLVVLWILMPFAIFGTKDRLDALIAEAKRHNALLAEILKKIH